MHSAELQTMPEVQHIETPEPVIQTAVERDETRLRDVNTEIGQLMLQGHSPHHYPLRDLIEFAGDVGNSLNAARKAAQLRAKR